MESLLGDKPYVAVYLDDILVTGPTDEQHLRKFSGDFKRQAYLNAFIWSLT